VPHGTPDWGLVGPKSTVYGLDDLGEHAVRLGSAHRWDRRGDEIFSTDFSEGIGDVWPCTSGLGGAIALQTGSARQGAFCLKLTAGRTADFYANASKLLPYPVLSSLGIECSFSYQADTDHVDLLGYVYDGLDQWNPCLRFYPNTGVLECQIGVAAWYQMSLVQGGYRADYCCNTMKIVFNVTRGEYIRAIVNENVYSLVGQPIYNFGNVHAPAFIAHLEHYAVAGENPVCYADCFIVTQNEP